MSTPKTGHGQISQAMMELSDAKDEIERLKSEKERIKSLLNPTQRKILTDLEADNSRVNELLELDKAAAYRIIERLKAENARLAAAINETASVYGFTQPPDCTRALADLLAPTIEAIQAAKDLIDQCALYQRRTDTLVQRYSFAEVSLLINEQLSRLRGLVEK